MKKIIGAIKLQILAGKANPAPPIGPALGQKGLNIASFCKQFNAKTSNKDSNVKLPVVITVYADRTFDFIVKEPPVSSLIKQHLNLQKGSNLPGRKNIGNITKEAVVKIAKIKFPDMGLDEIGSANKAVEGTARSMGINVI